MKQIKMKNVPSDKPNKNSVNLDSQNEVKISEEPSSPVILKSLKRTAKEKRASSKCFSSETLNKLDTEARDIKSLDTFVDPKKNLEKVATANDTLVHSTAANNHDNNQIVEEKDLLIEKKAADQDRKSRLSVPKDVRKKSVHSVALDDAFNILEFELNTAEEKIEITKDNEGIEGIDHTDIRKEKLPRGQRKKSVQSVALDNALNILDFELEPLATMVEENPQIESVELDETPILRSDIVDLGEREKSVLSLALENSFNILDSELDDVGSVRNKIVLNSNEVKSSDFVEIVREPNQEEVKSKGKEEFLFDLGVVPTPSVDEPNANPPSVSKNKETKPVVDKSKEKGPKRQQEEQSSLSFDLGSEPSIVESNASPPSVSKNKETKSADENKDKETKNQEVEHSSLSSGFGTELNIDETHNSSSVSNNIKRESVVDEFIKMETKKQQKDKSESNANPPSVPKNKETKSGVGTNKEKGSKKQPEEQSSLSFDLGLEPSIDESTHNSP